MNLDNRIQIILEHIKLKVIRKKIAEKSKRLTNLQLLEYIEMLENNLNLPEPTLDFSEKLPKMAKIQTIEHHTSNPGILKNICDSEQIKKIVSLSKSPHLNNTLRKRHDYSHLQQYKQQTLNQCPLCQIISLYAICPVHWFKFDQFIPALKISINKSINPLEVSEVGKEENLILKSKISVSH